MKSLAFSLVLLSAVACCHAQDSLGPIKATTKLLPDGTKVTTISNPDQHTWVEIKSDASGKVIRKTTTMLGEGDRAIGTIYANGNGQVIYKAGYKHDSAGRIVESVFTGPDGNYLGKRLFFFESSDKARVEDYDAKGVLIARPTAVTRDGVPPKRR